MLIQIFKQLKSSSGVKQIIISSSGNYFSAFISAISIILISRYLGPSGFGEFSAAFSLAVIFAKLNDAGITVASQKIASQSKNKEDTKAIIRYGYKLKIYLSILIFFIVIIISPKLTVFFKFSNPIIAPISIILGLSITYYDQLAITLLATHSFIKAALINIFQSTFKLISALLLTYILKTSILPILFFFLSATGIPVLFMHTFEPKWFSKIRSINIKPNIRNEFLSISKHSSILVFITGIIDSVGILFSKNLLTSYETGLLGGINRIALLFTLLGVSMSQVLYNRVSRYKKKEDLDAFIKKGIGISVLFIFGYILILPFLSFIVKFTIGSDYLEAIDTLKIILTSVLFYIISIPFTALFYSFNKNNYFSISGIIQFIIIIFSNIILIPKFGINGSAYAQTITRFSVMIFTIIYARMVYKEKFSYEK
jgi:O-antigen/teichoic acid export membrane protein